MKREKFFSYGLIAVIVLAVVFIFSFRVLAAWQEPTQVPPLGNIAAPLNELTIFGGQLSGPYNNLTLNACSFSGQVLVWDDVNGWQCGQVGSSNTLVDILNNGSDASSFAGDITIGSGVNPANLYVAGGEFKAKWLHTTEPTGNNSILGNLGIGTDTPGAKLEVAGPIWQTNTGHSVFIGENAGANDDLSLNENVFIGFDSGRSNTLGVFNNFIGKSAGRNNVSGRFNVALGHSALYSNIGGQKNVAVGGSAVYNNDSGHSNTGIGYAALYHNTSGAGNVGIGYNVFFNNIAGNYNTAIGYGAGYGRAGSFSTNGNTFLGYRAGYNITTGANNNVLLGYQAGENITTGAQNIIIGYQTDAPSATGNNQLNIGNTIYGDLASGNVGIGTPNPTEKLEIGGNIKANQYCDSSSGICYDLDALADASGIGNTLVDVLNNDSDASSFAGDITIGSGVNPANLYVAGGEFKAKWLHTTEPTGNNSILGNLGIGTDTPGAKLEVAGPIWQTNTGHAVYVGQYAGDSQSLGPDALNENVFIGFSAGKNTNDSGVHNVFVGTSAGLSNTSGQHNTALGHAALHNNQTGTKNVALGAAAVYNNDSGHFNIGLGYGALYANTSGAGNVAIGHNAFDKNVTGGYNTIMGYSAGTGVDNSSNVTGNVIFGYDAGDAILTGADYNTLIGYQAGDNITTGAQNIIIGYNTDVPSATGNNQLNIGNTIYGDLASGNVGIGTPNPTEKLEVAGNVVADGLKTQNIAAGGYDISLTHAITAPTLYADQIQAGGATGGLKGSGSVNAQQFCLNGDCVGNWVAAGYSSCVSAVSGDQIDNQYYEIDLSPFGSHPCSGAGCRVIAYSTNDSDVSSANNLKNIIASAVFVQSQINNSWIFDTDETNQIQGYINGDSNSKNLFSTVGNGSNCTLIDDKVVAGQVDDQVSSKMVLWDHDNNENCAVYICSN